MWIINDFSAFGMVSGWSMHGKQQGIHANK
jgi:hypothetical protein